MTIFGLLRAEIPIVVGWASVALLAILDQDRIATGGAPVRLAVFVWLFAAILAGAFAVVRHAEALAHRLGEPYGTLILTLSVTVIEVSFILVVMLGSGSESTLARDTVFSVAMITLNGVAGLCILLGGIRHNEQSYNLQGARAFLAVIMPLSVIALVMPNFTTSTAGPMLSDVQAVVFGILTLLLYGVFLAIQTTRHSSFFIDSTPEPADPAPLVGPSSKASPHEAGAAPASALRHTVLLLAALVPVLILVEELAHILEDGIAAVGAPEAVAGLIVAILVLSPEAMGALRAALANRLQRAVNISLGSALATIGLTVPSVLLIGILTGHQILFGLDPEEIVLLTLTLVVSTLTFGGPRTNILQGAVHLVLFAVYVVLLFNP